MRLRFTAGFGLSLLTTSCGPNSSGPRGMDGALDGSASGSGGSNAPASTGDNAPASGGSGTPASGGSGTPASGGSGTSTTGTGSAKGGSTGTAASASPGSIGSCTVFPASDPWNRDISADPVDPNSDAIIAYINANGSTKLHPDFGSDFGIPYTTVTSSQAKVPVTFDYESDPGPYPIPQNAPIEGAGEGDAHVLVVDTDACLLYETFDSHYVDPGWQCGSGAVFDLKTGYRGTRTSYIDCWTSADAAGLPVFPGLVRYDEVKAGAIHHAIRVTFNKTRAGFLHPATHFASSNTSASAPPMGLRLRLKASYDTSKFTGQSKVIVAALKTYGFLNADNGSNWYFQGAPDPKFDDEDLNQLKAIPGSAFEVVKMDRVFGEADCP